MRGQILSRFLGALSTPLSCLTRIFLPGFDLDRLHYEDYRLQPGNSGEALEWSTLFSQKIPLFALKHLYSLAN
jgi:hypothetical protein